MRWFILMAILTVLVSCSPADNTPDANLGKPQAGQTQKYVYDRLVPEAIEHFAIPKNTMVFLVAGQSNAANFGEERNASTEHVAVFYNGRLYPANDPMIGSNGTGGSVWPILADSLIRSNMTDAVILVPIAYGPSKISDWSNGRLVDTLRETLGELRNAHIPVDYILWHQGESDNEAGTSTETYMASFDTIRNIIREGGFAAPILVARTSYMPDPDHPERKASTDSNIVLAQNRLIDRYEDIYPGPNTDTIAGPEYRFDGVHFSKKGLVKHAGMWLQSLRSFNGHVHPDRDVVNR